MPGQEFNVGVTVMVDTIGTVPVFVALKVAILPVPLEANPIVVLEFVHEKELPAGLLTKLVPATAPLLQTEIFAGTVTVDVGVTVIV